MVRYNSNLLLFIFQQFASKIGSLVVDSFNYSTIDEYDVFARISVHHIVQMLIGITSHYNTIKNL